VLLHKLFAFTTSHSIPCFLTINSDTFCSIVSVCNNDNRKPVYNLCAATRWSPRETKHSCNPLPHHFTTFHFFPCLHNLQQSCFKWKCIIYLSSNSFQKFYLVLCSKYSTIYLIIYLLLSFFECTTTLYFLHYWNNHIIYSVFSKSCQFLIIHMLVSEILIFAHRIVCNFYQSLNSITVDTWSQLVVLRSRETHNHTTSIPIWAKQIGHFLQLALIH